MSTEREHPLSYRPIAGVSRPWRLTWCELSFLLACVLIGGSVVGTTLAEFLFWLMEKQP